MKTVVSAFVANTLNAYAERIKRLDTALDRGLISYLEYLTAINDLNAEVNREIAHMLSGELRSAHGTV